MQRTAVVHSTTVKLLFFEGSNQGHLGVLLLMRILNIEVAIEAPKSRSCS